MAKWRHSSSSLHPACFFFPFGGLRSAGVVIAEDGISSQYMGKQVWKGGYFPTAWVPIKSRAAFLPLASAKLIVNCQKSVNPSFAGGRKL